MIDKKRTPSLKLRKLEILDYRYQKRYKFQDYLTRLRVGYRGEIAVDNRLSYLDKTPARQLYDIRLFQDHYYFQMDTLILFPNFYLIIEIKNVAGDLYIDDLDQMNRHDKTFDSPIAQVNNHRKQLGKWLEAMQLPVRPIETLVVNANSDSSMRSSANLAGKYVRLNFLENAIEKIQSKYAGNELSTKELRKVSRAIVKADSPENPDVMSIYKIEFAELLKGVRCPKCGALPMARAYGKWCCSSCGATSRDAHLAALEDYRLLIGEWITRQEFQDFCMLPSRDSAKYILKELGFETIGSFKSAKYRIKF